MSKLHLLTEFKNISKNGSYDVILKFFEKHKDGITQKQRDIAYECLLKNRNIVSFANAGKTEELLSLYYPDNFAKRHVRRARKTRNARKERNTRKNRKQF